MWDWIGKTNDFFKNNADSLQGLGAIVGGVGSAYGAYKQGKLAQKHYDLNLDILREERRRRNKAEKTLENAWNASNFQTSRNKKKEEEDI
ncbi:hypothetical protein [Campylobacter sp. RM16192]|uniref:hypothetical protein n=1 Tax=Campylobacter sp. RM16192 TaxID=1660080 RepID=UPI001451267C|nr:hypothetical protein [Campylobacter sp. RM16192]QCD52520.1 hypothetical protein CDOMC_0897 [Campylobacter sp. RM16192]